MTKIKLRNYQEAAFEAALRYWSHGGQKPLISMATGLGKAFLGIALGVEVGEFLTAANPKRVAFLAHSKELIEQPYDSLLAYAPSLKNKYYGKAPARGIVRANRNQASARFLFATMQTLAMEGGARLEEVLSHGAFDLVILDEAHHTAAKSYADIIIPKMLEVNPQTKLLGLTATPARSDGKALDTIFDYHIPSLNIMDGMKGGWLKQIHARSVKTDVSIAGVGRDVTGDFKEKDLASALRVQNWTEIIKRAYFDNDGPDHYAGSFMPSVEMGRALCDAIRDEGIPAASIDSEMVIKPDGEIVSKSSMKDYERARQYSIDSFRGGDTRMLGGYSVLLEGFDAPIMDMILQGRPTDSEVLLTQLIGRGLRQVSGIARILDDPEKQEYLVQRNGEDVWHKYTYANMPYPTECLILDFTLKDTSVLLSGSLAGDRTVTPEEAEKEVLEILEATPIDKAYDIILKQGKGVQYAKRNFFKLSTDNWTFWQDATMSAYLGCAGEGQSRLGNAMFIYPRQNMLVGRMNAVLDILDQVEGLEQEELEKTIKTVRIFREAFSNFLMFQLTNIPVTIKESGGYQNEVKRWESPKIGVKWLGMYVDHNVVWEAALPISQKLSVGGFFVDKKRSGARNEASDKQKDLLYNEKMVSRNGNPFPNIYHTLPAKVNATLDAVPGLELFRIEKPVRHSLVGISSGDISGMINHVGIYSVVMDKLLVPQLKQAQQLYNYWTALWQII